MSVYRTIGPLVLVSDNLPNHKKPYFKLTTEEQISLHLYYVVMSLVAKKTVVWVIRQVRHKSA